MNKTTILVTVAAAAIAGAVAGWWLASTTSGAALSQAGGGEGEREILYWVAPMDPSYRRDKPGKSPMGMDLVPVYAGAAGDGDGEPALRIRPAVVNNIGVKTAPVERGTLHRRIETVGFITVDGNRIRHIHVRAEGWIEELAIETEGDRIEAGALLFRIYSPALVSAQDEYLQALRSGQQTLIRAAGTRLRALGMRPNQVEALRGRGETRQLFEVRSPMNGYVLELNVRQGMFVQPGATIMSLADLTRVWADVDVFENQIDWIEAGQTAHMKLALAPEREWVGQVDYVYPAIRPESRTARVRLAFDNPDLVLKPNMYAKVGIDGAPRHDVAHVPSQAVIRTGRAERVILALGGGRFRPAQVRTGLESGGRVEIIEGLTVGETIVVSSQFLLDSEASLDASLLRMLDEAPDSGHRPERRQSERAHAPHGQEDAGAPPASETPERGHEAVTTHDHD